LTNSISLGGIRNALQMQCTKALIDKDFSIRAECPAPASYYALQHFFAVVKKPNAALACHIVMPKGIIEGLPE
jgi:hypothetical protein